MKKSWKIFIALSLVLLFGLSIVDKIKNVKDEVDEIIGEDIYMGTYQLEDKTIDFYRSPIYVEGQGYYYLVNDVKHSITVNRQLIDTNDQTQRFFVVPNLDYTIRENGIVIEPIEIIEHEEGTLNIYLLDKSKQYRMINGGLDYKLLITVYYDTNGRGWTNENHINLNELKTMMSSWKTSSDYISIKWEDHSKLLFDVWEQEHQYTMEADQLSTTSHEIYSLEVNNNYYVQYYKSSNVDQLYKLSKNEWNEFNKYIEEMIKISKE